MIVPLIRPLGIPVDVPSSTRKFVNAVDALEPGDRMLLVFDYSIGGGPDVDPEAQIVMVHALSKGVSVVCVAFVDTGLQYATKAIESWEQRGKVYGEDMINLGYAAGSETAISAFAQDIRGAAQPMFGESRWTNIPLCTAPRMPETLI